MPNPHVPGTLDAPITATESGANKYCQWSYLLNAILPNSPSLYVNSTCNITQSLVRWLQFIRLHDRKIHGIPVSSYYKAGISCFFSKKSSRTVPNGPPDRTHAEPPAA